MTKHDSQRQRLSVGLAGLLILTSFMAATAQPPGAGQPRTDASLSPFKKTMEHSLAEKRTRIRQIAEPLLERLRKMRGTSADLNIEAQSISVQGAEATYQNAKLSREIAEIAVKEYEEGIYFQNRATGEAELRLAEADVRRGTDQIEHSTQLLERVKKAASGSVFDIMSVVQVEAMVMTAKMSKRKAELELEQAKSKLNLLEGYKKPKRIKELRSAVEMARAIELEKEQTLELEKSKLARMKTQAEGFRAPAKFQPILSLLADAMRLDGQTRDKLATVDPKNGDPEPRARKTIGELAEALDQKVNEAERLFEDLKFAELAREINAAAAGPRPSPTAIPPAVRSGFFEKLRNIPAEDRARLKNASEEERARILKKSGFTDAELEQMRQMRERMERAR
jgi:hypothetical protein